MEASSPWRDLQWRAIGPTRQGGRIESIACFGSTFYVGVGSGNAWKSTDDGKTWRPIFEKESAFAIGDIAVAPSDHDIVWVGTGESQPRHSGYSYSGTGVFKSTDGGGTWRHMGLADTHHIGEVLIHPTDPNTVYVAAIGHAWTDNAERGLFRTRDGGETWEHVLAISDQTGVVDVVMDPRDPATMYAAAWHKTRYTMAGRESGIYKTVDGGTTWKQLRGGLPHDTDLGRCGLAVAAGNPNVVYAFVDNHTPQGDRVVGAEVYRSDDRGETWRRTHESDLYHVYKQYGWKFADIRVVPDDEDALFILGNRVFYSDDAGQSFARIGEDITRLQEHGTQAMHLDHHDLWIDPANSQRVVLANDGGLFVSRDRGKTWLHLNNLPIGEYYTVHITEGESPFRIYGGTQDNASHSGPSTATLRDGEPDDWTQIFLDRWGGGDGFVTLPDPTDPEWVYYEHQHGDVYHKKLGGSLLTGAKGDRRIRPRARRGEPRYRFGWYTPFVISHHEPKTLYFGGNRLLKSTNQGGAWEPISPEFVAAPAESNRAPAPFGVITSLSESRHETGVLYVGLDNGQIHRTNDDGRTWTNCSDGLPGKWVSRVEMSRHDRRTVYVSQTGYRADDFSSYLFRSDDMGRSWVSIAANLPAESVNVIREDSRSADVLYVGTDLGVYVSTNRGKSWESLSTTLPTTPVHDLAFHPIEHKLVIATHGRSMFMLDAATIVSQEAASRQQIASTVHDRGEAYADATTLRSLGPAFKPGRVSELAVDPTNSSTWYLAHGSGGLWKTLNRGVTWRPIFDDGGSCSLGYVTVDPQNPDTVWLGTGENISNRSVGYGDGVYRSEDAGETWTNVGLHNSQHIGRIIVDPRDSNVVYVAAEGPLWSSGGDRGLYKTTDGGKTWTAVLQISDDTGVTDIVMDPRNPDVLYASSFQRRRRVGQLIGGGPESAVYKTVDAGLTWKKLTDGIPDVDKGRIALAVSPQKAGIVYALVAAAGEESGFFRSDNHGESWARMSNYKVVDPQYYGEIYADPHHFDRIYAMDVFIHRSDDGGRTFQAQRWDMHVDNHAMVFDPSDPAHLLVGNDGGLYESFDSGANWRHFTNLTTAQFYRVAVDDAAPFYNVYGGTQDNGSMAGPSQTIHRAGIRTSEWTRTRGGDGFQTRVDPQDPSIIYTLSQNGDLARSNRLTGETQGIRPRPDGGESLRWHWDSPLVISPHEPQRLYFAGNRIFRSDDRGNNWRAISGDLTRQLDPDALPVMGRVWGPDAVQKHRFTTALSVITALDESTIAEGLLIAGTDDGLVHVSTKEEQWQRAESFHGVPAGTYVSDVCASSHDTDRMYATFNNHQRGDFRPYVLSSDDGGTTWTSISSNLPDRHAVWCVHEDRVNPDLLFAGTEFGLFFSLNRGRQWQQLRAGIPTVAVRDLAVHEGECDLIAATFGRGFFVLDDFSALRHLNASTAGTEGLLPPHDCRVYSEHSAVEAVFGNFSTPNAPVAASLCYTLAGQPPAGTETVISITSANGTLIRELRVPGEAGLHRVTWDLRRSAPTDNRPRRRRRRSGPLVEPGEYGVQLLWVRDGTAETVGDKQTLKVTPLSMATPR